MKLSFAHAGSSKLAGLILLLLSAFTLCSAKPLVASNGIARPSLGERGLLSARKLTPAVEEFKKKFDSLEKGSIILTTECEYFDFTPNRRHRIGSTSFDGCVGLVVASSRGAIMGHWTVTSHDMGLARESITNLWDEHRDDLEGATAVVYGEVDFENQDTYAQENEVHQIRDMVLEITEIRPDMRHYVQAANFLYDAEADKFVDNPDIDNMLSGGMIVENEGGGLADTRMSFVDIEVMGQSVAPNDGS